MTFKRLLCAALAAVLLACAIPSAFAADMTATPDTLPAAEDAISDLINSVTAYAEDTEDDEDLVDPSFTFSFDLSGLGALADRILAAVLPGQDVTLDSLRAAFRERAEEYYAAVRAKLDDPAWREAVKAETEERLDAIHAHLGEVKEQADAYYNEHKDEIDSSVKSFIAEAEAAAAEWQKYVAEHSEEWKAAVSEWRAKIEEAVSNH